jgi:hypothetical protein
MMISGISRSWRSSTMGPARCARANCALLGGQNGSDWDAAVAADPLFTALVKGYIRHDLYVQQIYADFPEELRARYGPGLQQLVRPGEPASVQPRASGKGASRLQRRCRCRSWCGAGWWAGPATVPDLVQTAIDHDPIQPRGERARPGEPGRRSPHLDHHVLRDVLPVVPRPTALRNPSMIPAAEA